MFYHSNLLPHHFFNFTFFSNFSFPFYFDFTDKYHSLRRNIVNRCVGRNLLLQYKLPEPSLMPFFES